MTCIKYLSGVVAVIAISVTSSAAMAAWTFVDADPNTNSGDPNSFSPTTSVDDLWGLRSNGSVPSLYESSTATGGEDSPEIWTTISGLNPNTEYEVNVHFFDNKNSGNRWNIRAGFSSGSLTLFSSPEDAGTISATAAPLADTLTYVSDPSFAWNANALLHAGYLGTTFSDGSGEITVFVDDFLGGGNFQRRSWYEGVSFQQIPEPSAVLLLTLGAGLCALRRR